MNTASSVSPATHRVSKLAIQKEVAARVRQNWESVYAGLEKPIYEPEMYLDEKLYECETLVDEFFRAFLWCENFRMMPRDGSAVSAWGHSPVTDMTTNLGYISCDHERIADLMTTYFDDDYYVLMGSENLNWALMDMMVYTECRMFFLETNGYMRSTMDSLPWWGRLLLGRRWRKSNKRSLAEAMSVYDRLAEPTVDWLALHEAIDISFRDAVGWRPAVLECAEQIARRAL